MAVSLTKGEKVNLSKVVEKLANVTVGLGWDAAEYGDSIDCDSSVFVLKNVVGKSGMFGLFKKEEKARLVNDEDIIYYGHKKHSNGCIKHHGDNLVGGSVGDDEQISINLKEMPEDVTRLAVVINIYNCRNRGQHFGMIKNCFARIVDDATKEEICRYNLSNDYNGCTALIVAEFYREDGEWHFEAVGKLDESEKEQYHLKKELMKIDKSINDCLDANDENGARQYAMKKITVQQKIDTLKDTIEEFKKAKDQQDEIRKAVKQELDELKEEKERTIYQMEADQQIIQLHEGMNASASSSESDHMLERVREGAKKTRERAAGAQIAYDTSAKAQDRRLEAQARNREADELLAEMKRKRGNN